MILDDFYPGSKKKRRPEVVKPEPKDPYAWDANPYKKVIKGVEMEVFTIGALAKALERPVPTIRMWLDRGYLPSISYRLPAVEVHGKMRKNRRLYTRQMIEAAIASFKKRNLIGSARIEWSELPDLVEELYEQWKTLIQTP